MDLSLKDARVVVTAGGAASVAQLSRPFWQRARVATCDIDRTGLGTLPDTVFCRSVDVSDASALSAFVDDAVQALGGLDCLVNNAGIAGPTGRIEDLALEDIQQCMTICLTSQFVTIGRAIPYLRQSGNPSIVNMSSLAGRLGFRLRSPTQPQMGRHRFDQVDGDRAGDDGIRVNAVLPGLVAGDRQRRVLQAVLMRRASLCRGRAGRLRAYLDQDYVTAQQIADQILYLASPRGRTISGQAISVCGDTGMLG
ncbi:SDR family oxidoreductase [Paracoccus marcusii]|uniref:SDR family oxidoreductase n=1 Tax=Paracoccus marcusii TaxID=59779 RepID=UPI002ED66F9B|nr:SDR family oxidoreductase [Paracoccus marcusii]